MIDSTQIDRAKSVRIEDELARRGFVFKIARCGEGAGPCLDCGGTDRFSINTRKQVYNCRGCGAKGGDAIDLVQFLDSCDFREAVEVLNGADLPAGSSPRRTSPSDAGNTATLESARAIWHASADPRGTLVEVCLRRDGLDIPEWAAFNVIRFNGACVFGDEIHPAMICLVRDIVSNKSQAIHRTALSPDGSTIKSNGKTLRMSLGSISGGAIKLDRHSSVGDVLAIGEGVETCLAGRHYGYLPCWSVVSKAGLENFPLLPGVEQLQIFVDDDPAGEEASAYCKAQWTEAGRHVRLVWPSAGKDLRDELRASLAARTKADGEFLAAVQAAWPGATIVTEEEKVERAQFRKELAALKAANDLVYSRARAASSRRAA
jgi:hypothetical protein